MALLKNSLIVAGGTLASRSVALIRDILLAKVIGAGLVMDALIVALRAPNIIRQLLAEGALNVTAIPFLSKHMPNQQPTPAAERFSASVLSLLVVLLVALCALGMWAMPVVVTLIAPGFHATDPARFDLAVWLSRLTFPYTFFIVIVSFYGAILNALGRFIAFAIAPLFLNISFIIFLTIAAGKPAPENYAAIAFTVGGVLQLAWMVYMLKRAKFSLRWQKPHLHPETPALLGRLGPASLSIGVQLVNGLIDGIFASWLAAGAVSYLFYADRLYYLPVSLLGIAVSSVLLPELSRRLHAHETARAAATFTTAMNTVFALGLASALGLLCLAPYIMELIYQRGAFGVEATRATAYCLMAYAMGLPAVVASKLTMTVMYAQGDTKTPLKFALFTLGLDTVLNFIFIGPFGYVGLALTTALSAWVSLVLQMRYIHHQQALGRWRYKQLIRAHGWCLVAGVLMCGWLFAWAWLWPWPTETLLKTIWLTVAIGVGGVLYLATLQHRRVLDFKPYLRLLTRRP